MFIGSETMGSDILVFIGSETMGTSWIKFTGASKKQTNKRDLFIIHIIFPLSLIMQIPNK